MRKPGICRQVPIFAIQLLPCSVSSQGSGFQLARMPVTRLDLYLSQMIILSLTEWMMLCHLGLIISRPVIPQDDACGCHQPPLPLSAKFPTPLFIWLEDTGRRMSEADEYMRRTWSRLEGSVEVLCRLWCHLGFQIGMGPCLPVRPLVPQRQARGGKFVPGSQNHLCTASSWVSKGRTWYPLRSPSDRNMLSSSQSPQSSLEQCRRKYPASGLFSITNTV